MSTIIQHKRGTATQWTSLNPILYAGEFGWETDTNRFKIGNGTTAWNSLPYASPALSAGVPSGGATGQILSKNSGTDYDTSWIDVAPAASYTSVIKHTVKNGSAPLTKGTPVYVSSSNGTNMIVSASSNASEATSSKTLGLLAQDLSANGQGFVIAEGLLSGLNTSSATAGDAVWLGVGGALIFSSPPTYSGRPYAPAHMVFIGIVTRAHATQGEIFVKVQNGFELDELHNVDNKTVSPRDKDILSFDYSTLLWRNKSFSELGLATSSYVDTSIANLVASAPSTLDTLNELAAALGNDASFATTVTTSLAGKANLAGGNAFTEAQTITGSTDTKQVVVKANSTQTNNIFEVQNSAGTTLTSIANNGGITAGSYVRTAGGIVGGGFSILGTAGVTAYAPSATSNGIIARGAASQSADLQQWQDSSGTVLTKLSSGGSLYSSGNLSAGAIGGLSARLGVVSGGASTVVAIARGAASQTADLQQWQDSTGTVNSGINAVGQIYSGSTTPQQGQGTTAIGTQTPTGTTNITITTGTNHGISVGQTVVIAGVTPSGYNGTWTAQAGTTASTLVVNIGSNPGAITVAGTVTASATLSVTALSSKNTPIVVRAASGQASNLLEVQNSSGASQFTVTPTGGLLSYQPSQFQTFTTTNIPLKVIGASNQIQDLLQIQNSSSTATAGVSAIGQIYTGATGVKMGSQTIAINTQTPTGTTLISITTATTHGIQVGQSVTISGVTPSGYNGLWLAQAGTTGSTLVINIGSNPGAITVAGTVQSSAQLSVIAPNANTTPVVIQAAASQANNLQEWQDSTGAILASITSAGRLGVGGAVGTSNQVLITNQSATSTVLGVKGAASQSGNLQEWTNSAGTVLLSVSGAGNLIGSGFWRTSSAMTVGSTATTTLLSNATMGHLVLQNVGTQPNNVVGGGVIFVDTGALKYRGTSGSAQNIVSADGTINFSGVTTLSGGLTLPASTKITGDFDNATVANRTLITTSTTNASAGVYVVPNGTSTAASIQATNAADPTNASKVLIATNGSTDVQLVSGRNGTGTYLPLSFYTNGSQQMQLSTAGALSTTSDISSGGVLKSTQSSGDEGGQIDLTKAVTNTTLTTGISIDVYQNKLRFFETGGTNRGYYIDISAGGSSVGTNLVGGGSSFTGGTLTSNLTLVKGDGSPNSNVYPLTFQTNTNAPAANAGSLDYDGTVFYATPNTTPGRALDTKQYYYISNGAYGMDFSSAATAQSILGGTTTGITLSAGTTYEFELYTAVQWQSFGDATATITYNLTSTTVSGSPTLAYTQLIDYANNTTAFTTAATISSIRSSSATGLTIAAVSSGSRYYIIKVRGTIRVTGTGSAKIYPSLTASATTVNIPTIQTGTIFKLTPIGNGTVTTVGAWA